MLSAVKCPSCGNEISKLCKALKNSIFCLEAYECNECHNKFKVIGTKTKHVVGWFVVLDMHENSTA